MKNEYGAGDLDQLNILDERWVTEILEAITERRVSLLVQGFDSMENGNTVVVRRMPPSGGCQRDSVGMT